MPMATKSSMTVTTATRMLDYLSPADPAACGAYGESTTSFATCDIARAQGVA